MGMISVDTSELEAYAKKIEMLTGAQADTFFKSATNEMAARLIALVKPRTPVDSGELRGAWDTALAGSNATGGGGTYSVTLTNETQYASYVEYGHRQTPGRYVPAIGKRLTASWVDGQFFLRAAEQDLEKAGKTLIQRKLDAYLRAAGL